MTNPARTVICLTLAVYCLALLIIAVFPLSEFNVLYGIVGATSLAAMVGLLAHATSWFSLPREEWAYLLAGFSGLATLLTYEPLDNDPTYVKWRIGLLIVVGIMGSYGAHLAQERQEV